METESIDIDVVVTHHTHEQITETIIGMLHGLQNGSRYKKEGKTMTINLETVNATDDDKKPLIKNGIPKQEYIPRKTPVTFQILESLYETYKHSVPSQKRDNSAYFYALPYDKLSTQDIIKNKDRKTAKEELELAVIDGIVSGTLVWPDDSMWYWQSGTDRDFVLLKKWIVHPEIAAAQTVQNDTQVQKPDCINESTQTYIMPETGQYIRNKKIWHTEEMEKTLRCIFAGKNFNRTFITDTAYSYEWKTTAKALHELDKISGYKKELKQQERFFNKNIIMDMARHYEKNMRKYLTGILDKNGYVSITYYAGKKRHTRSLCRKKELESYIRSCTCPIRYASSYRQIYDAVKNFIKKAYMPNCIKKSDAWKNAFYGKMSYHTIDNMIRFHDCRFFDDAGNPLSLEQSLYMLEQETDRFSKNAEYYKLYATAKKMQKENRLFIEQ